MRASRIFATASLSVFVVCVTFSYAWKAEAIRNGRASAKPQVFFVSDPSPHISAFSNQVDLGASSALVKYKRCLVTAAHVINLGYRTAYLGSNLNQLPALTDARRQQFQTISSLDRYVVPYRDIAVVWLQNLQDGPDLPPRIRVSDYPSPLGIGKPEALNLVPNAVPVPIQNGTGLYLPGFGFNDNVPLTYMGFTSPTDVGLGIRRYAMPIAVSFGIRGGGSDGSAVGALVGPNDAGRMACTGDSGAPLLTASDQNTVRGVVSGTVDATCNILNPNGTLNTAGRVNYSGFDDTNNSPTSNWKSVNDAIARICGKTAATQRMGLGKVWGTLSPEQDWPIASDTNFNNSVNCGDGVPIDAQDCGEFMHDGQTLTLNAEPSTGWKFSQWLDGGNSCPCDGSNNPVCAMNYDDMGTYTDTVSNDTSTCVADFVPIVCGDNNVDNGEQCDEGGVNTPTCDSDCTDPLCGDGLLNTMNGEQCDDGNNVAGDGCSPTCQLEYCGNTVVDPGEQCDSGGVNSPSCDYDCSNPVCGDGLVNTAAGEQCDDGNLNGTQGDSCATDCHYVSSSSSSSVSSAASSLASSVGLSSSVASSAASGGASSAGASSTMSYPSSAGTSSVGASSTMSYPSSVGTSSTGASSTMSYPSSAGTSVGNSSSSSSINLNCTTNADCSGLTSCNQSCCVTYSCVSGMCTPDGSCP